MSESISKIVSFDHLPTWAHAYAKNLSVGDSVCLSGPLGAGKTSFTRALVTALGVDDMATFGSPTFSVMNVYRAESIYLRHLDLYRLETFSSFEDLDLLSELKKSDGISFVEWGDRFPELKKIFTHFIQLDFVPESEDERLVCTWLA